jgi:hypothetical protein
MTCLPHNRVMQKPASFASTFALSQAIAMAVFYGGTDADFLVERGDSWFDQLHDDHVRSANAPVFDGAGGA